MNERQRRRIAVVALLIFIGAVYLLVTSSPWLLLEPFVPGLPVGTLTTWAGIVSLPLASFLGFHSVLSREARWARVCRGLMVLLLLPSAAWGLVSYGLAGNWAFNFLNQPGSFQGSNLAGEIFLAYTISIVAMSLFASTALCVFALFANRRRD